MEFREAQAAVPRQCRYRAPCLLLEIMDALYADATRLHFEGGCAGFVQRVPRQARSISRVLLKGAVG